MRSVNELTIRASESDMAQLLSRLEAHRVEGWSRNTDAESRLQKRGIRGGRSYCFACLANERRPAASLWLQPRGSSEFSVANIVSGNRQGLSDHEYNLILEDFESAIREVACDGLEVVTELVPHRIKLEVYLSPEAMRRLIEFTRTANKQALHPNDCRRWQEFVIQSHVERAELDPVLLDRWLTEQGWPEEQRQHLLSEYEASRSVLTVYDEERLERCLP
jgi:hypothetical protein